MEDPFLMSGEKGLLYYLKFFILCGMKSKELPCDIYNLSINTKNRKIYISNL